MVTEHPDFLSYILVVSGDSTSFAESSEIFPRVKAEGCGMPHGAGSFQYGSHPHPPPPPPPPPPLTISNPPSPCPPPIKGGEISNPPLPPFFKGGDEDRYSAPCDWQASSITVKLYFPASSIIVSISAIWP